MKLLMELLQKSLVGGLAIGICGLIIFLFRKKISAKCEKRIWILIALYLLVPLGRITVPSVYQYQIKVPDLVLREYDRAQITREETLHAQITDTDSNGLQSPAIVPQATQKASNPTLTVQQVILLVWMCVGILLTAYYLLSYLKTHHRIMRSSHPCTNEDITELFSETAAELGINSITQLRIVKNYDDAGPFTMGITKPIIFLPGEDIPSQDLKYILRHELTHCRKRDILWEGLLLTACIIYWFHPLVWLMQKLAQQSIEKSCDEEILKNASSECRKEYSDVIMAWVGKTGLGNNVLSTGYMQNMTFLKLRFANIFNYGMKKDSKTLTAVIIIGILFLGCLINIGQGEKIYRINKIPIDFGIEVRTDLDGDRREDRVRVYDARIHDVAYTQIIANVNGEDVTFKNYDGYYASSMACGDLSGNGKADILLTRWDTGSTYGAVEISVLYLEDGDWKEYPDNFIHNPEIALEQPLSFNPEESWWNGEFYIDAVIVEKGGKTLLRFAELMPDAENDETVKCIEVSYREEGWFIEDIQIIENYYTDNYSKILFEDVYSDLYSDTANTPLPLENLWDIESTVDDHIFKFATGLELVLPKNWIGKVVFDKDLGPISHALVVREKTNWEAANCGDLFYLNFCLYEEDANIMTYGTVLGVYKQGDIAYALILEEPGDLSYVEGDAGFKAAYEEVRADLDSIQIKTNGMSNFIELDVQDLNGIQEDSDDEYTAAYLKKISGNKITVDVVDFITSDNIQKIIELGLTENDMLDGYYIDNPDSSLTTWDTNYRTVYTFIDWNGDFTGSHYPEEYTTTDISEFEQYIRTYENETPGMPFFFRVNDGVIELILEKPIA